MNLGVGVGTARPPYPGTGCPRPASSITRGAPNRLASNLSVKRSNCRQVLDRASPLALLAGRCVAKRPRAAALQNALASAWPQLVYRPDARAQAGGSYL